ncbi:hypothetical protein B0T17DRAFT_515617 [Bombardia bombarda]|uniref:Secreted protein n=1 Tax=Bombardia bombarda TaxID=252184 RepID=A0AA39XJI3_9PEZI|nr:hypothetical protein B0T17DRAFT_515617 [Bombardia bombarda]
MCCCLFNMLLLFQCVVVQCAEIRSSTSILITGSTLVHWHQPFRYSAVRRTNNTTDTCRAIHRTCYRFAIFLLFSGKSYLA